MTTSMPEGSESTRRSTFSGWMVMLDVASQTIRIRDRERDRIPGVPENPCPRPVSPHRTGSTGRSCFRMDVVIVIEHHIHA